MTLEIILKEIGTAKVNGRETDRHGSFGGSEPQSSGSIAREKCCMEQCEDVRGGVLCRMDPTDPQGWLMGK